MEKIDLRTIEDAIRYWRDCIDHLPGHTKAQVGGWIVGAMSHANHDSSVSLFNVWYRQDEDFAELFDTAAQLEMEPDSSMYIDSDWEEILEHLAILEAKYKIS